MYATTPTCTIVSHFFISTSNSHPKRRRNTFCTQLLVSAPDLVPRYISPEDMHGAARCSFRPATSLRPLAGNPATHITPLSWGALRLHTRSNNTC